MRITYRRRLEISHQLAKALPSASVVCCVKGKPFIIIDLGETISYSGSSERGSWAGSYEPVGSRRVMLEFGKELITIMELAWYRPTVGTSFKILHEQPLGTLKDVVATAESLCNLWLRPVDVKALKLPVGHEYSIRKHPLEALEPRLVGQGVDHG